MSTAPTFARWLRAQGHRDDAVGDLARDLLADPLGPADDHVTTVGDYVATVGGTAAADACRAAAAEWEATR
ncbi:hypothetical protein ACFY2Y_09445 [Janibacter hoylei]|uniref:hypothetical protein n=1 Tax=Janibacter hoylei TaxID=364298 RepID=UPI0036CA7F75